MSAAGPPVEVPPEIVDYLNGQRTLTLATVSSSGVPRASTFLYVNEGPTLYFWSRAGTITTSHIDQNPVVSFAIDHYSEDLNATKGLQGVGECQVILSGEQIARVADLFGQRFPTLSPGSTMSISFFRITPTELQFIDNTQAAPSAPGAFGAEFHRERSYSVIQALPLRPAQTIVAALGSQSVKAGETVVRAGAPADKFFIIVSGEAELTRADGEKVTLGPGRLFGEVTIMRDQPRAATVTAASDLELLALDRDTFRDLISQAMEITPDFDQIIRDRLDAS